jgi:hypothetical protein
VGGGRGLGCAAHTACCCCRFGSRCAVQAGQATAALLCVHVQCQREPSRAWLLEAAHPLLSLREQLRTQTRAPTYVDRGLPADDLW